MIRAGITEACAWSELPATEQQHSSHRRMRSICLMPCLILMLGAVTIWKPDKQAKLIVEVVGKHKHTFQNQTTAYYLDTRQGTYVTTAEEYQTLHIPSKYSFYLQHPVRQ